MQPGTDGPYTHADFTRMALAEFPELREEFEQDPDLLHLQMHAFQRLAERAQREGDWATYKPCMRLAHELWRRPDHALLLTDLAQLMTFGWEAHVLPVVGTQPPSTRLFISHDGWVELLEPTTPGARAAV